MKATKQSKWVSSGLFQTANPHPFRISDVVKSVNKFGKDDNVLYLRSELNGEIYMASCWGKNWNALIDKFGDETDSWRGKLIQLTQVETKEGKTLRDFNPIG